MNNEQINEKQLQEEKQAAETIFRRPEVEALKAENERLKQTVRMRGARDVLTKALGGTQSPELLFEAARGMLQFDERGELINASAIVAELKSNYPEQFRPVAPASIGGGNPHQASLLDKATLARMKPADIARLDWADVRQVLSEK
ncbi:MAG: hypothetical protein LC734_08460 [Acidobacteria bacterium]|nr:hypothetical protein [Acidobacteriota bacterium]